MKYTFGIILAGLMLVPGVSQAYEIVGSSASKIDDTTYLYAIVYQLGFEKYDVLAPIGAVRDGESTTSINYSIHNRDEESLIGGTASALVLSTAQVEGNHYLVPAGEARQFMLFGIVKVTEPNLLDGAMLRVTKLPFTLRNDQTEMANGLSRGELTPYVTLRAR